MNSRNKNIGFLMLLLLAHIAFAGKEFDIDPIRQAKSLWCWAACCEMVFDAYKLEIYSSYGYVDQYDVANWAVNGNNEENNLSGDSISVDQVLWHFGSINSNYTAKPSGTGQGNISKYDLSYEIDGGRPIIVAVAVDEGSGAYLHDVLIRGYTGPSGSSMENVIFNDPDNGGSRRVKSYAEFVRTGNSWAWHESLRLVTNPREPIPLGGGPSNVVILLEDDCTTEITQSPQSLSYRAYKSGDSPVSWEWKLVFPHSGGEAVVASWNINTSQKDLTWSIPNFSLPSFYDWSYRFDGKIGGRIEVICLDPDYHADAINVMYIPGDLYPGVLIYEDKVIINNQPNVRAHKLLLMQNDQFLSGGNINLKSGERIDIKDGITIANGSQTNLIIDPTLR